MDQAIATIVGVSLTGIVTVIGWNVSNSLAKRREAETRRAEATLKHIERQIEEFYGPLLCLIEQIFNVWTVRENLLFPPGRPSSIAATDPRRNEIFTFFQTRYFFPFHEKIRDVLASRLYLVDGGSVPESFSQYLEHSTQQVVQHRLYADFAVSTDHIPGVPWPDAFYDDVKTSLDGLMAKHERCLRTLHAEDVHDTPAGRADEGRRAS
jgi:hypothetical protein